MKPSKFTFIGHEFRFEFDGDLNKALHYTQMKQAISDKPIYLIEVEGKKYYYDEQDVRLVLIGEMDWEDYQEIWWCDGLARNLEPIATIDVGSLCLMRNGEIEVIDMRELPVQNQEIKIEKIF
jgi:hypothetical protein